jgi:hypothetical protein
MLIRVSPRKMAAPGLFSLDACALAVPARVVLAVAAVVPDLLLSQLPESVGGSHQQLLLRCLLLYSPLMTISKITISISTDHRQTLFLCEKV